MTMRLHKLLAAAGFGSRRGIETQIAAGRIRVNGQTATIGQQVERRDRIEIDGRLVHPYRQLAGHSRVLLYHKPAGRVTSRADPEGRPTVFEQLPAPHGGRWITVGRLDLNTSGLLLVTNDGDLAHGLMHPSRQLEREYAVRVRGEPTEAQLQALRKGVTLEDGPARFTRLREAGGEGSNRWYHAVLTEGRNREVRRLWESQDVIVSRLIRIRFGDLELPRGLRAGRWQELSAEQVESLRLAAGLPPRAPASPGPKSKPKTKPKTDRRRRRPRR